jgi:hypothetical protein
VREVAPETPRIPKRAAGGCDPLERQ